MKESKTYQVKLTEMDVKHLASLAARHHLMSQLVSVGVDSRRALYLRMLEHTAYSAGMKVLGNGSLENLTDLFGVLRSTCVDAGREHRMFLLPAAACSTPMNNLTSK